MAEHAFPLKWLDEATALRDHLLSLFEQVDAAPDHVPEGALTFVVVGGGPTGVELVGAIAELLDHVIARDHPNLDPTAVRIVLVEMLDDVLPLYTASSQRYTRRELDSRGMEVRTGTAIAEVGSEHVRFDDGEVLATRTVIWTAGVQGNPVVDAIGVERGTGARVPVRHDLRLPDDDAVSVVGDVAGARDANGELLPQLAPVAIQEGRYAAEQIIARLQGEPTEPFRYRDKGHHGHDRSTRRRRRTPFRPATARYARMGGLVGAPPGDARGLSQSRDRALRLGGQLPRLRPCGTDHPGASSADGTSRRREPTYRAAR